MRRLRSISIFTRRNRGAFRWHIPEAHALESWSDARASDGTTTIMQPMIEPLFGGRSRHELMAALLEDSTTDPYKIVRAFWQTQLSATETATKIVWDNAALISPATAACWQVANEEVVDLKFRGRSVRAPIWILPGQADDCVTVHLGYGRTPQAAWETASDSTRTRCTHRTRREAGRVLEIGKSGNRHVLVTTQPHWQMAGRSGALRHAGAI